MLVILTDEQILAAQQVCQGCVLADQSGTPRWSRGKLGCGHPLEQSGKGRPTLYECQMGFRIANIE
jgi:hypothetical protein